MSVPQLSEREEQVLNLLARGFSYVEIARLQKISVHTARTHAKNLYWKLNVHSKSEAVFEAAALGLLNPATWTRAPSASPSTAPLASASAA
jgi:DNA-binding CsgD family transcriptional regulator